MDLKTTVICPNAPSEFRVDVAGTKGTLTISREQLTPEMKDQLAAEWRKKLDEPVTTLFRSDGRSGTTSSRGLG